jgi:hypothetical protein
MTRGQYLSEDSWGTPFSRWLREYGPDSQRGGLDVQNLDYVLFNYKDGSIGLLEEKQYWGKQSAAQADTHGIVAQLIEDACKRGVKVKTRRGWRPMRWSGYHLLRFSAAGPADSTGIEWDGVQITAEELRQKMAAFGTQTHPDPTLPH